MLCVPALEQHVEGRMSHDGPRQRRRLDFMQPESPATDPIFTDSLWDVLTYVDPASVCRARRVCSSWKHVIDGTSRQSEYWVSFIAKIRQREELVPANVCQLFNFAEAVNCSILQERCLQMLCLEFCAVVEQSEQFADLTPRQLSNVLKEDDLVCGCELQVLEAVLRWYVQRQNDDKYEAIPELLALLRWAHVPWECRKFVLQRAAAAEAASSILTAQSPTDVMTCDHDTFQPSLERHRSDFDLLIGADDALDCTNVESSCSQTPSVDIVGLVSSLWPEPLHERMEASAFPHRLHIYGVLVGVTGTAAQPLHTGWPLQCTQKYVVGRSSKADVRVGYQTPMSYVSSQHFRLSHEVRYPASDEANLSASTFSWSSRPLRRRPVLEAWLEDLSQNGTYVNGVLVGRGNRVKLNSGDSIRLVYSYALETAHPHSYPAFTFYAPRPVMRDASAQTSE